MSKYTAEQVLGCAEGYEALGEPLGASMLRAYAATLSQQAEWPSDDALGEASDVLRDVLEACGHRVSADEASTALIASLQSVRPPAVAVSDTPRYREWRHLREYGVWSDGVPVWAKDREGRMNDYTAAVAVIEELASRHAPTKE
jgi:hypothetical protein